MAKKDTTKGKFYRFAPIYWYSWGLKNSALEKDEKKKMTKTESVRKLFEGEIYEGKIVMVNGMKRVSCPNHPAPLLIRDNILEVLCEDDEVTFVAKKEPNRGDSSKDFWYATKVAIKDE